MSLKRNWIASPNYSSRGGQSVRLIVLHSSEGATTYQSLGNFFANSSSGVSSHTGIDDTPNTIGEYVKRQNKAWTASGANPVAVQAELCCPSGASANWTRNDWLSHPTMLSNTAAWIAEEAAAFGIPIVRLSSASAQSGGRGVCQHADLGSWGGGHYDLGVNFPIDDVIGMAAGHPAPTPQEDDDDMRLYLCVGDGASGGGKWWITDLQTKRYCPSLQHAKDTDYWLTNSGLGAGKPLVANRSGNDVAGPISIRQDYIDAVPEVANT